MFVENLKVFNMTNSILLQNVSTEQLVNLIDERTQKSLEKFKKELDEQSLAKKRNNNRCSFFRIVVYLLQFIMLLLQAF